MSNVKRILHYFFVSLLMILGLVSQSCPNVHKTGITQTSDELNVKVSPQLIWYVELKTMDHFSRVPEHDLGILAKFPIVA